MKASPGEATIDRMERRISASEEETEAIGEALGRELQPGGVLLLRGDLGVGKTVLVRGLATALGIDRRAILSPTFTLIDEHDGPGGRLVHVDLYRLDPPELDALGLDELLAADGVKAIEWPERLHDPPPGAYEVTMSRRGDGERVVVMRRPTAGRPSADVAREREEVEG